MRPFQKFEWEAEAILPSYDFSDALALPVMERFERSVAVLQEREKQEASLFGEPSTPFGPRYTDAEIRDMERDQGASFAPEVRQLLRHWKLVGVGAGMDFYGADSWKEDEVYAKHPHLVIGDYWRYADGDQLVMPLSGETDKVFLYLHEHGPKIEEFAPSFSLALWRMAHEKP